MDIRVSSGVSIDRCDIAVVGAGAAGLFAAVWAGRTLQKRGLSGRVIAFDGARKLGAKILVAGGGRCNVTHHVVDEQAYAGSSRNAIRQVLRRFDVAATVRFFSELDVELKREETGKLFPTTDDAHTVLNALLRAAREAGTELRHPWRVREVRHVGQDSHRFEVVGEPGASSDHPDDRVIRARMVILATGGMALPRTGSDGAGYGFARALGHSTTPRIVPALVPLLLGDGGVFIKDLSGLTLPATIELWSSTGRKLQSFTNSTLCTHFGLSGPSVLDMSRYWLEAHHQDPGATLTMNWLPGKTVEGLDQLLSSPASGTTVGRALAGHAPERLARAVCAKVGVEFAQTLAQLKREHRKAIATMLARCPLNVTGDRGFTFAEVTAGGVPLSELHLGSMESRVCPGLYLCGEICDVDGRIGGFNFQWAWASGFLAGQGAAAALAEGDTATKPSRDQPD